MDADKLEAAAKEARRRADIAKHKPLPPEKIDQYGAEDEERAFLVVQQDCLQSTMDNHGRYMASLADAWKIVRLLRVEALYWRQKYEDTVNGSAPS